MNQLTVMRRIALFLTAAALLAACNQEEDSPQAAAESGPKTGTYKLTPTAPIPAPAPHNVTDKYIYHSTERDQGGGPGCDLVIYEDSPDDTNNYFQFGVGGGCAVNLFEARVGTGSNLYDFFGNWLRPYNTGSGPFATGFYTGPNGEEGTFEFYEEGRTD